LDCAQAVTEILRNIKVAAESKRTKHRRISKHLQSREEYDSKLAAAVFEFQSHKASNRDPSKNCPRAASKSAGCGRIAYFSLKTLPMTGYGDIVAKNRWFADSSLEETGFEIPAPLARSPATIATADTDQLEFFSFSCRACHSIELGAGLGVEGNSAPSAHDPGDRPACLKLHLRGPAAFVADCCRARRTRFRVRKGAPRY